MEEIINRLSSEQKDKVANLLCSVDEIFEEASCDFDSDYHNTQFYEGLYDIMYRLGIWC